MDSTHRDSTGGFEVFHAIPPMTDSRNRAFCKRQFGTSPFSPICPVLQWDGTESRERAYCMGCIGISPFCPIRPMVQCDRTNLWTMRFGMRWDTLGISNTSDGTVG